MDDLIDILFAPPELPVVSLPLPGRVAKTLLKAIADSYTLAFRAGLWQGAIAGALLTTIVILGLSLRRSDSHATRCCDCCGHHPDDRGDR